MRNIVPSYERVRILCGRWGRSSEDWFRTDVESVSFRGNDCTIIDRDCTTGYRTPCDIVCNDAYSVLIDRAGEICHNIHIGRYGIFGIYPVGKRIGILGSWLGSGSGNSNRPDIKIVQGCGNRSTVIDSNAGFRYTSPCILVYGNTDCVLIDSFRKDCDYRYVVRNNIFGRNTSPTCKWVGVLCGRLIRCSNRWCPTDIKRSSRCRYWCTMRYNESGNGYSTETFYADRYLIIYITPAEHGRDCNILRDFNGYIKPFRKGIDILNSSIRRSSFDRIWTDIQPVSRNGYRSTIIYGHSVIRYWTPCTLIHINWYGILIHGTAEIGSGSHIPIDRIPDKRPVKEIIRILCGIIGRGGSNGMTADSQCLTVGRDRCSVIYGYGRFRYSSICIFIDTDWHGILIHNNVEYCVNRGILDNRTAIRNIGPTCKWVGVLCGSIIRGGGDIGYTDGQYVSRSGYGRTIGYDHSVLRYSSALTSDNQDLVIHITPGEHGRDGHISVNDPGCGNTVPSTEIVYILGIGLGGGCGNGFATDIEDITDRIDFCSVIDRDCTTGYRTPSRFINGDSYSILNYGTAETCINLHISDYGYTRNRLEIV